MQKINFENGFHLDLNAMNFLQNSYSKAIAGIVASAAEDNYAVSGVEIVESVVEGSEIVSVISNGWVVIGGEFMEFRGGNCYMQRSDGNFYVEVKNEYATNVNANGQVSEQALQTTYATLCTYKADAIPVMTLIERRLVSRVKMPSQKATITLGAGLVTPADDTERTIYRFGYKNYISALPKWEVRDNSLYLRGVFMIASQDANYTTLSNNGIVLGVLYNWIGRAVDNIKTDVYFMAGDGTTTVLTHAQSYIQKDGTLVLKNEIGSYFTAAVFDMTPHYLV